MNNNSMRIIVAAVILVGCRLDSCLGGAAVDGHVPGEVTFIETVSAFEDFKANVTQQVLLFKIYVPGCGACLTLSPKIKELAAEHKDVVICEVNYMEVWPVLLDYDISVVPTCIFVIDGIELRRVMTTKKEPVDDAIKLSKDDLEKMKTGGLSAAVE